MSTWYSKHVEENIWRINNIKCITLVFCMINSWCTVRETWSSNVVQIRVIYCGAFLLGIVERRNLVRMTHLRTYRVSKCDTLWPISGHYPVICLRVGGASVRCVNLICKLIIYIQIFCTLILLLRSYKVLFIIGRYNCLFLAQQPPPLGPGLLILEVSRSFTMTHHNR